ncbi:hypothetical protein ABW19_dt0208939 [Dactylella cylindrospora]|nr:hypothetical protein ABW19_dt0208939 [Dactylella cylindrospora]
MKISLSTVLVVISSIVAAPVFGAPVAPNISVCSAQVETALAIRRWPETNPQQLFHDQQTYLRINSFRLPACKPFEYADENTCVQMGIKSGATIPATLRVRYVIVNGGIVNASDFSRAI